MRITNAGMTLLPWARKMVRQSIQVQEMMQSMQNSVVGQLRISCTTTAGKYCITRRKLSHPNLVRDAFWAFIYSPENEDVLALPEA